MAVVTTILSVIGIILASLLALIVLIMLVPLSVRFIYGDTLSVTVRAAYIPIFRIPKPKPKFRQWRYSPRMIRMREKREAKKAERKRIKDEKKAAKKASADKQKEQETEKVKKPLREKIRGVLDLIDLITDIVKATVPRLGRFSRFYIRKLHITAAKGDAADTAVEYGKISQALAYLLELLNQSDVRLKYGEGYPVSVNIDYIAEKTTADIDIEYIMHVWQLAYIGLRALLVFLKSKLK
ncbi:MAG: hypothetical protein GX628_07610 [Clostridiales bacterium]|nr:hypothetical protein [Clostridiales bacterium]